jgi:hypothetical protein
MRINNHEAREEECAEASAVSVKLTPSRDCKGDEIAAEHSPFDNHWMNTNACSLGRCDEG